MMTTETIPTLEEITEEFGLSTQNMTMDEWLKLDAQNTIPVREWGIGLHRRLQDTLKELDLLEDLEEGEEVSLTQLQWQEVWDDAIQLGFLTPQDAKWA